MMEKNQIVSMDDIHAMLLEMLKYIDSTCKKNNIMYFLSGGSALGAIREKGLIPWDDDVDIMLPRDEYEKLIAVLRKDNNKDYIIHSLYDDDWDCVYACLIHGKTTGAHDYLKYNHLGVTIDILPIDGLPDSVKGAKQHYSNIKIYYALLNAALRNVFQENEVHKGAKKILHIFGKLIGTHRLCEIIDKKAKRRRFQDCAHVGCAVLTNYMEREYFDRKWFDHQVFVEFENTMLPVMNGYDNYLHALYGDYMKRPDEESNPRHHTKYYWK